jgi:hypothetical protein
MFQQAKEAVCVTSTSLLHVARRSRLGARENIANSVAFGLYLSCRAGARYARGPEEPQPLVDVRDGA